MLGLGLKPDGVGVLHEAAVTPCSPLSCSINRRMYSLTLYPCRWALAWALSYCICVSSDLHGLIAFGVLSEPV